MSTIHRSRPAPGRGDPYRFRELYTNTIQHDVALINIEKDRDQFQDMDMDYYLSFAEIYFGKVLERF